MPRPTTPANKHTRRANLKEEYFAAHRLLMRQVTRMGRVLDDDRWGRGTYAKDLAESYLGDAERAKAIVDRLCEEFVRALKDEGPQSDQPQDEGAIITEGSTTA